ncbi:MAG: OmpA family protein, partial [Acidobacteriota bacterium]
MKKLVLMIPVLALALGGTTACATKKMVKTQVGEVNGKVETLSKSVEENQERTRTNEGRIGEVDSKASAAGQRADAAGQRADAAGKSATDARAAADAVNTRADAIERASKRLVYEVTLSEDKGGFKFGKAIMPDSAKADLDKLVQQLKAEPNGAYIEIEGHTDNAGPKSANYKLGLDRAEAVKRYLYEQHQVP